MVEETSFEGVASIPPAMKARVDREVAGGKHQLLYIFVGIWFAIALLIYFTTPKMSLDEKAFIIFFFGAFLGAAHLMMSRQDGMRYSFFTKLIVKDLSGVEGKVVIFTFENAGQKKEFRLALAGALNPGQMIMDTPQHVAEALTDPEKLKCDPNIINYNYKYALELEETPFGVQATFKESQASSRRSKASRNQTDFYSPMSASRHRILSHVPMSNSVLLLDRQTAERLEKLIQDTGIVVKISRRAVAKPLQSAL